MDYNYYNSISDSDLQKGGYYPEKIAFFETTLKDFKAKFGKELLILDLACNEGGLSKVYSQYGKVCGIDLNEKAVAKAKEKGIEAVCGDAFKISELFPGKKFDVVVAGDIIEHLFDTDLFLKKIFESLNDGGMLLLSTPNLVSFGRRIMTVLGKNPYCEYSSKKDGVNVGHIRYYTLINLKTQLGELGYKDIEIISDTLNLPLGNKFLVRLFPQLGRELLAKAYKK